MPRRRGGRRARPDPFTVAISIAPASTNNRLVFKWNRFSKAFDISSYHPAQTGNRISANDLSSLFSQASTSEYATLRSGLMNIVACLPLSGIVLFMCLIPLIFTSSFSGNSSSDSGLPIFIYFIPVIFVFIFCCFLGPEIASKAMYAKRLQARKTEFDALAQQWTQRYRSQQISFRMGDLGAYVMMDLEFLMNAQAGVGQGQPMAGFSQPVFNQGFGMPMNPQQQPIMGQGQAFVNQGNVFVSPTPVFQ